MKIRLDQLLVAKELADTLESARALIGAGEVYINDEIADKAGQQYADNITVRLKPRCPFVSRGGLKLEKGLDHFTISPHNQICADIGASTGGFSDCLLQRGAAKVYAIDVAYGLLAWEIRQHPKVVVLERCNARNLTSSHLQGDFLDLAVIDASFISLAKLIPPIIPLFAKQVKIVALIKPQFELARKDVGPGGIVADKKLHEKALQKMSNFVHELGLQSRGVVASPILGAKGNREYLMYITGEKKR